MTWGGCASTGENSERPSNLSRSAACESSCPESSAGSFHVTPPPSAMAWAIAYNLPSDPRAITCGGLTWVSTQEKCLLERLVHRVLYIVSATDALGHTQRAARGRFDGSILRDRVAGKLRACVGLQQLPVSVAIVRASAKFRGADGAQQIFL